MAPRGASHGASSGPPLLSGPLEIRTTIYQEVLQGTAFVVDTPLPLCTQAYMRLTPAGKKRVLPGLLRVSKQIRTEALPIFSNIIEPLLGYFSFRLLHPMNIPNYYFTNTRKVYISDYVGNYMPLHEMPMLEVVVLERRQLSKSPHHVTHEITGIERLNVQTFLTRNPLWSKYARMYESFCEEIEAATPQHRRVQILLHVYFESFALNQQYLDVMIDWREQKIVQQTSRQLPVSSEPKLPWEVAKQKRT